MITIVKSGYSNKLYICEISGMLTVTNRNPQNANSIPKYTNNIKRITLYVSSIISIALKYHFHLLYICLYNIYM